MNIITKNKSQSPVELNLILIYANSLSPRIIFKLIKNPLKINVHSKIILYCWHN